MPRVSLGRSVANERNLAARIGLERERRSWTYEGLARRMTDAGFVINASSCYKIEKGKPPRRITADELIGFAYVFDLSLDEILVPIELIHEQELRAMWTEMGAATKRLDDAVVELTRLSRLSRTRMRETPALKSFIPTLMRERVAQHLADNPEMADMTINEAREREVASRPYPPSVWEAMQALYAEIDKALDEEEASHG